MRTIEHEILEEEFMKGKLILMLFGLFCLGCLLSGCGGGGGGGGLIKPPGVTMNLGADSETAPASTDNRVGTLKAPLANGNVIVYDYTNGNELWKGTLDANGTCSLPITPGGTVLVVATGNVGDKTYRLSAIIPIVPEQDFACTCDPASTIAAECIATKYAFGTTAIDKAIVESITGLAQDWINAHPGADYSLTGGLIKGSGFGGANNSSIDVTQFTDIINALQDPPHVDPPPVDPPPVDPPPVDPPHVDPPHVDPPPVDPPHVDPPHVDPPHVDPPPVDPPHVDPPHVDPPPVDPPHVDPPHVDPPSGNNLILAKNAVQQIKDAGIPLAAMVSEERPDIKGLVTDDVISKYKALGGRLSELILPAINRDMGYYDGTNYNEYASVFDLKIGNAYSVIRNQYGWFSIEDDTDHNIAGQITIIDETGEGATGDTLVAKKSGSTWIITQTSRSDATQKYVAVVPTAMGADPVLSGSVTITDKVFTSPISFSGTVTATGPQKHSYSKIVFDGTLNAPELHASGRYEANFVSSLPAGHGTYDEVYNYPTKFVVTNGNISITGGGATITISGDITLNMTVITANGRPKSVPTKLHMSGTYQNSKSSFNFTGAIDGEWTNPQANSNLNTANGTVSMSGGLTRTGYPGYHAAMVFTTNNGTVTDTIDLRVGANTLSGSGNAVIGSTGHLNSASMTLTNQDGVQINLAQDTGGNLTGNIKESGVLQANITTEQGPARIRVAFKDNTFVQFPL